MDLFYILVVSLISREVIKLCDIHFLGNSKTTTTPSLSRFHKREQLENEPITTV